MDVVIQVPRRRRGAQRSGDVLAEPAPRALYVRRDVVNGTELIEWAREQGVVQTVELSELHVTVAYSRKPVLWSLMPQPDTTPLLVPLSISAGLQRLGTQDSPVTALVLSSVALAQRWRAYYDAGASWDWPTYRPHVTLGAGEPPARAMFPRFPLVLGPEIWEEAQS